MKFSSDDFKRLYAEMPDEELRSLVREELSEVARPCYDAELARRGLQPAKPRRTIRPEIPVEEREEIAPKFAPESEEVLEEAVEREEEEDLAPAAIFTTREEAKAAKARLQSAAIPAFLEDDTPAGGGFRLLVAAPDVVNAREALGEEQ
jgi:cell division septation protein DedD